MASQELSPARGPGRKGEVKGEGHTCGSSWVAKENAEESVGAGRGSVCAEGDGRAGSRHRIQGFQKQKPKVQRERGPGQQCPAGQAMLPPHPHPTRPKEAERTFWGLPGPGAKPWGFPRLPDHKPRHWLMPLWGEQRCGHGAPGGPHPGTCDSPSQGPVSWCPIPSPSGAPFQLCDLGPLNLSMPRFPHLETGQDARPM